MSRGPQAAAGADHGEDGDDGIRDGIHAAAIAGGGRADRGIGVTFGSGCTSGHGVCGNARLSPRSMVATVTFMITCGITVYVIRHVVGG